MTERTHIDWTKMVWWTCPKCGHQMFAEKSSPKCVFCKMTPYTKRGREE